MRRTVGGSLPCVGLVVGCSAPAGSPSPVIATPMPVGVDTSSPRIPSNATPSVRSDSAANAPDASFPPIESLRPPAELPNALLVMLVDA